MVAHSVKIAILKHLIMEKSSKIPRLLHQVWLGDQSKRPVAWMDTWKAKHPEWEYKLWTDTDFIDSPYTPLIDNCPTFAGKSDIIRYLLLYEYGGVYVDADSECLEPLDDLLDNEAFCSWENEYATTGLMLGAFMGSIKGNPFFLDLLGELNNNFQGYEPIWYTIGPGLLTRMVGALKYEKMTIYPSHYFSPVHHSGLRYSGKGKVYANHFWESTPKLTSQITKEGFVYKL